MNQTTRYVLQFISSASFSYCAVALIYISGAYIDIFGDKSIPIIAGIFLMPIGSIFGACVVDKVVYKLHPLRHLNNVIALIYIIDAVMVPISVIATIGIFGDGAVYVIPITNSIPSVIVYNIALAIAMRNMRVRDTHAQRPAK